MSNHITPTAVPTEETVDSSAENSTAQDVQSTVRQVQAGPVPGQYVLSRGVRFTVALTSVSLLVTGLVLVVLGGIGTVGGFMQGLSGLNAIVTGISLIIAGTAGCVVVFMSRTDKVGRMILLVLVAACHASGAFAVQCTIIVGQIISINDPCEDSPLAPEDDATSVTTPVPANSCSPDTTRMTLSILILLLSIVGFVLGIICSAFCYLAAPRIWCCLGNHTLGPNQNYTAAEVEPVLVSAQQRGPNA